jgi:hypothetical protein
MLVDFIVGIVVAVLGILDLVLSPIGAFIAIIGLLSVSVGYGLWKAKPWAWPLGLWAGVVYVAFGVLASWLLVLVGIVNLLFYYFNRADLKRYLGRV